MSRSIDPLIELYIFETNKLLEELEINIQSGKQTKTIDSNTMNDIFYIIQTIKGSAAMMLFTSISCVAQPLEDLFYYLKEQKEDIHHYTEISDVVYHISDYIKNELDKIEVDIEPTGNPENLIIEVNSLLKVFKSEVEPICKLDTYTGTECIDYGSDIESKDDTLYHTIRKSGELNKESEKVEE